MIFTDCIEVLARTIQPPSRRRSLCEFAPTLTIRDGGPCDGQHPVPMPAQVAIWQAIDGKAGPMLVILGPVQDGKTLGAIHIPITWLLCEDARPILFAMPRVEDCAAVYRARILPTLGASGLGWILPEEGGGSRGGVPESILAAPGARMHMRGGGGANEAQQANLTVRAVFISEVDSIHLSTRTVKRGDGSEGRRKIELFDRRRHAYGADSLMVLESTLKSDRDSLILELYNDSTGGRLYHPCPDCGHWAKREWSDVTYDPTSLDTAAASVRLACAACGVAHTNDAAAAAATRAVVVHRGQTIDPKTGIVTGTPAVAGAWGIRWSSIDSPRTDLCMLAKAHLRAVKARDERGDHSQLRQFFRDFLALPYLDEIAAPPAAVPSALAHAAALTGYTRGTSPFPGIAWMAEDCQEREHWWIRGVLEHNGERQAVVDWGIEYLCHRHEVPTKQQRLDVLNRIAARTTRPIPGPAGPIPTVIAGVDVGGKGWLDIVDEWLRSMRWAWWAVRGDARWSAGADDVNGAAHIRLPGWGATYKRPDGRRLFMADSMSIKGRIADGLAMLADPAQGATHPQAILLPAVAQDDHLVRHLCAEVREVDTNGDVVWVQRSARNDLLDGLTYGDGLAHLARHIIQAAAARRPVVGGFAP